MYSVAAKYGAEGNNYISSVWGRRVQPIETKKTSKAFGVTPGAKTIMVKLAECELRKAHGWLKEMESPPIF